jgi:hypothetical protein
MQKTYEHEDIEQILAEADDLLEQIDPEVIEFLKEEQRAQFEQQTQSLKKLKSEIRTRSGRKDQQTAGLIAKECTRRSRIL